MKRTIRILLQRSECAYCEQRVPLPPFLRKHRPLFFPLYHFPTISNKIAGGLKATLILIQIVLARAIRCYHMSQGLRRDPCRHYQSHSEWAHSIGSVIWWNSVWTFSVGSVLRHDKGCGPATQSRTYNQLPPYSVHHDDRFNPYKTEQYFSTWRKKGTVYTIRNKLDVILMLVSIQQYSI